MEEPQSAFGKVRDLLSEYFSDAANNGIFKAVFNGIGGSVVGVVEGVGSVLSALGLKSEQPVISIPSGDTPAAAPAEMPHTPSTLSPEQQQHLAKILADADSIPQLITAASQQFQAAELRDGTAVSPLDTPILVASTGMSRGGGDSA